MVPWVREDEKSPCVIKREGEEEEKSFTNLAFCGPTLLTSKDEDAVIRDSGILPDSIPRGSTHSVRGFSLFHSSPPPTQEQMRNIIMIMIAIDVVCCRVRANCVTTKIFRQPGAQ